MNLRIIYVFRQTFFFPKQELNYMAKGVKEDDTPELGEF